MALAVRGGSSGAAGAATTVMFAWSCMTAGAWLFWAGMPAQCVLRGRLSPFITRLHGPMVLPLPITVLYSTTEREPMETRSPTTIVSNFMTRSSKRWVCSVALRLTQQPSPIFTMSGSVMYSVSR
jgi:hypothetical protein